MSKYVIAHLPAGWLLARVGLYEKPWAKKLFVLKVTGDLIISGSFHQLFAPSNSSFWRDCLVVNEEDIFEFENDKSALLAFEVMI